jgi:hypothetical protein
MFANPFQMNDWRITATLRTSLALYLITWAFIGLTPRVCTYLSCAVSLLLYLSCLFRASSFYVCSALTISAVCELCSLPLG